MKTDEAQIHFARCSSAIRAIVAPISGRAGARLVDPATSSMRPTRRPRGDQPDRPGQVVFTLPEEAFQDVNHALHASDRPLQVIAYSRNGKEPLGAARLIAAQQPDRHRHRHRAAQGRFANPAACPVAGPIRQRAPRARPRRARPDGAGGGGPAQPGRRPSSGLVDAAGKAQNQPVRVASTQDGIAVIAAACRPAETRRRRRPVQAAPRRRRRGGGAPRRQSASAASGAGGQAGVPSPLAAAAEAGRERLGQLHQAARSARRCSRWPSCWSASRCFRCCRWHHCRRSTSRRSRSRPTCPARARRRWPRTSPSRWSASSR